MKTFTARLKKTASEETDGDFERHERRDPSRSEPCHS